MRQVIIRAQQNSEIAADWREQALSPYAWEKCTNQTGAVQGEAGGFHVDVKGLNRRAYLKPAKSKTDDHEVCRAAREKIAADLAYDLGLPVPPALLTVRENPPPGCPAAVVMSLIMYPAQYSWKVVRGYAVEENPHGLALASALAACSGMLVFDTWIAQTDHGDHPENIVWGYDPDRMQESQIVFLDFAFSLGHHGAWKNGAWKQVRPARFPAIMQKYRDATQIRACIERIESFAEDEINRIVRRIPESHLIVDQQDVLIEGLIGRRALIRPALKTIMGEDL